ncbi:hypothetical protein Xmau_01303 [Xenorhabdus mauleonii]|uniref:Uncharacterized protein n=1 Tax=Xenorhabdus mauleonii TaxID=351675 RepID=A0A1I3KMM3_9GAMM|nr:hypothetical protein Xmau_01303 [Xenorhabdus mauleonii]SFI73739.1 hypothetical protein SAMN05421680_103132 [Xenorhabdus mauleonii]
MAFLFHDAVIYKIMYKILPYQIDEQVRGIKLSGGIKRGIKGFNDFKIV